MSLYNTDVGQYTQGSETAVEGNVITAVYDIELVSTLMEAIVKIQGKRDIQNAGFGLMSNDGTSQSCNTSVVYSAYDDVMVITIRPRSSNDIGGPGNTWQIYGDLVVDGVAMELDIKAPETYGGHAVSSTPALPAEIGSSSAKLVVSTDTSSVVGNEGDKVGSITINGTEYGIFISSKGSTVSFEIKENATDTPLPIDVSGLNTYGQRIDFYKTDGNTYIMSAINLVW